MQSVYERMLDSDIKALSSPAYRRIAESSVEPLLRIPTLIGIVAEDRLIQLEKRLNELANRDRRRVYIASGDF